MQRPPPPQSGLQLSLPGGGRAPTSLGFVLRGLHLTYITPQNSFANCIPVTNDLKITKAFGDTVFCLPPPAPQNTMDFSISLDTLEDLRRAVLSEISSKAASLQDIRQKAICILCAEWLTEF